MAPGCALLWWGRFRGLDLSIKVVVLLLAVSTLLAAAVGLPRADFSTVALWPGELIGAGVPFLFLLALAGVDAVGHRHLGVELAVDAGQERDVGGSGARWRRRGRTSSSATWGRRCSRSPSSFSAPR